LLLLLAELCQRVAFVAPKTWLIGKRGGSFTEQGFTDWFADQMAKAGLPKGYTPHGLRKHCLTDMAERGCTIYQIMSVSGYLTMKEVERYTRMADRAPNARAAMAGRV
jgi:site-specific recombinase XerD